MKIRLDYVTNSSSSSFFCEICSNHESLWDDTPEWYIQCENCHGICKSHLPKDIQILINNSYCIDQPDDSPLNSDYELRSIHCPICNLSIIIESDIVSYLEKVGRLERSALRKEVRGLFKNNEELQKFLRS